MAVTRSMNLRVWMTLSLLFKGWWTPRKGMCRTPLNRAFGDGMDYLASINLVECIL